MPEYNYCPQCAVKLIKNKSGLPTCPAGHYTKYTTPVAAVSALIRHNGEYLFLRRAQDPLKGAWGVTGGFMEPNETAKDAILREVTEETQLTDLTFVSLVGTFPSNYGGIEDTLSIGYLLESPTRDIVLSDESAEYMWCKLEDAPTLAFRDCQLLVQAVKELSN